MNPVRIASIAAVLCCAAHTVAQEHNTLTTAEKSAGWALLFDGTSLADWDDPTAGSPDGSAWRVQDGCIVSVRRARIRGDLVSKRAFENFEMTWDWKIEARGNSGVKFLVQAQVPMDMAKTRDLRRFEDRVQFELINRVSKRDSITPGAPYEEYLVAFEYQLIDNDGHSDARAGLDRTAGALYSMIPPSRAATRPVGEFNRSRLVLRGNRIEHWMNGEKVLDAGLDDPSVRANLAKRWGPESKVYELLTTLPKKRAPVALQHHVDEVWFRNIKIRELRAQ